MIRSKLLTIATSILISTMIFSPTIGWAKDKSGSKNGTESIVWLNGAEVSDLLTTGVYWCMQPQGDTCSFNMEVIRSEGNEFSYRVISFWDQSTLIDEILDASVAENGILCEPNRLNLKRIKVTDLQGNLVEQSILDGVRTELRSYYEEDQIEGVCFAYTRTGASDPNGLVQYFLLENGEAIDPIEFIVDYSANAAAGYVLRWEK